MLYRRPSFIESFKRSWRTVPVKGKIEYAFLFFVSLVVLAALLRVGWVIIYPAFIGPIIR